MIKFEEEYFDPNPTSHVDLKQIFFASFKLIVR
jgi:hypothetical protein